LAKNHRNLKILMKTAVSALAGCVPRRLPAGWVRQAVWLAALVCLASGLHAQVTVRTLGGGHADVYGVPHGYVDGRTLEDAMFNTPLSPVIGPDGNLWLADRDNGAIRKLLLASGQTRTVMTNLNQPVAVVTGRDNSFYVLTAGDGAIRRYDTNLNLLAVITTALVSPNAMTMDSATNFYVAQANGTIVRVTPANPVPALIGTGLSNPKGIAVTRFGLLAVSDTGNHVIKLFDPAAAPSAGTVYSGTGVAGFNNGPAGLARFNAPEGIAEAPNGVLIVADRLNHRMRLVETNGSVSTFYGVPPENWLRCDNGCGWNNLNIWEGWADGPFDPTDPWAIYPAAREPVGIVIVGGTKAYATELGYHLVREVTGFNLNAGGGGGGGGVPVEPVDVEEPVISPVSGYFPNGQIIVVGSPNPDVFFTVDGTDPTTNSTRVPMTGNRGAIWWNNPTADLTKLKVRAFIGTNASDVVSGLPASVNTIGVTPSVSSNYFASPGSTIYLPVVVNLIPGAQMRSVFYRVEVQAAAGVPSVSEQFRLLQLGTNDFLVLAGLTNSTMSSIGYGDPANTLGGRRGLLISAVGTNLGGVVSSFGVLNLLAVPIPATAPAGAEYTIQVINPSATVDGGQVTLPISPASPVKIVVGAAPGRIGVATNVNGGVGAVSLPAGAVGYLVGDSSPSGWFNAGEFGDGNLDNADVNNAFYASLGLRVPPSTSDAFDAMDSFPLDTPAGWGGDGEIRFLDWQVTLWRASRVLADNYVRVRMPNGLKTVIGPFNLTGTPDGEPVRTEALPGSVWVKNARFVAGIVGNAQPGTVVDVPVTVWLREGQTLSGMSFSAVVRPATPDAPPVRQVTFVPRNGAPAPTRLSDGDAAVPSDTVYRVWEFIPTGIAAGETLLGYIRFTVPAGAPVGALYRVRFLAGSGGDTRTMPFREPQFESLPGAVFVGVPAVAESVRISDDWKRRFFGDPDNPDAANTADPDRDGVPNWQEYLAGTNPINPQSRLRLQTRVARPQEVVLSLLTAPDKTYQLEYTENLTSGVWTAVRTIAGDGQYQEITAPVDPRKPRFYRVRLLP
jgi:sugar lactone lactonase YvrE